MLRRGGRGPKALAASLDKVTRPALRKRGIAAAGIVTDWADIVGPELAAETVPQRLMRPRGGGEGGGRGNADGGVLHIRVSSALAPELQHLEPQLVERINGYFGYRAVARLKLIHGPIARPAAPQADLPPALDPAERAAVAERVAGVGDADLRAALDRLGTAVKGAARRQTDRRNRP